MLLRQGVGIAEVARVTGVHASAVRAWSQQLGLRILKSGAPRAAEPTPSVRRQLDLLAEGKDAVTVAALCGVSAASVRTARARWAPRGEVTAPCCPHADGSHSAGCSNDPDNEET